jgi:hypothetical protein
MLQYTHLFRSVLVALAFVCAALPASSYAVGGAPAPTAALSTVGTAATAGTKMYLPIVNSLPPCQPAYSPNSPWNTPIGARPAYDPLSSTYVAGISGVFGSDPTQYTYPVYEVSASTPKRAIAVTGYFSEVTNDTSITNLKNGTVSIPMPAGAAPSAGSDSQVIFWNRQTGDEWGFSGVVLNTNGTWTASSGYHYNTYWDGSPPVGKAKFASRGSGLPFMAGLVRPCEINRKQIDHALAFAYSSPSSAFIFPATKSDGGSAGLPEGARIQLDPALSDAQIQAWGCSGSCLTIAHAMQKYGMIVVDRSSRPKIFVEYEATANWNSALKATTISKIPYTAFKVLKLAP